MDTVLVVRAVGLKSDPELELGRDSSTGPSFEEPPQAVRAEVAAKIAVVFIRFFIALISFAIVPPATQRYLIKPGATRCRRGLQPPAFRCSGRFRVLARTGVQSAENDVFPRCPDRLVPTGLTLPGRQSRTRPFTRKRGKRPVPGPGSPPISRVAPVCTAGGPSFPQGR